MHRRAQKEENNCRRHQSEWKPKLSSKERRLKYDKLAQRAYPGLIQGHVD